uniref:Uncharacterized protein n=1 Tax=Solanum lycopersicum TaxID=4081 RepID=A0A3Q7GXP9_SOLLC
MSHMEISGDKKSISNPPESVVTPIKSQNGTIRSTRTLATTIPNLFQYRLLICFFFISLDTKFTCVPQFVFFPHLVIAMMIEQTGTSAPSGDDDLSMGISLMLDIYLIFNCGYCHCCSSCYGHQHPLGNDDLSMGISLMLDTCVIFNCVHCTTIAAVPVPDDCQLRTEIRMLLSVEAFLYVGLRWRHIYIGFIIYLSSNLVGFLLADGFVIANLLGLVMDHSKNWAKAKSSDSSRAVAGLKPHPSFPYLDTASLNFFICIYTSSTIRKYTSRDKSKIVSEFAFRTAVVCDSAWARLNQQKYQIERDLGGRNCRLVFSSVN